MPIPEEKVFTSGEAMALYLQHERPASSIAFGQTSGITTCLVLSGETSLDDLANTPTNRTTRLKILGDRRLA